MTTFYHGSRKLFLPDDMLAPQADGYVHLPEVTEFETLVESLKPAGKLSRFQSVFLSQDPDLIDGAGGCIDAIYVVEAIGNLEASDLAWYTDAWIEYESEPSSPDLIRDLILNYWNGTPYINSENSNVEYRVPNARIIAMVELNVEICDLEVISQKKQESISLDPF